MLAVWMMKTNPISLSAMTSDLYCFTTAVLLFTVFSVLCKCKGNYALFVSLNVCNFVTLRRKLVYSFLNRIRSSSNTLICTLFNSVHFKKCNLKKEWDNVLLI